MRLGPLLASVFGSMATVPGDRAWAPAPRVRPASGGRFAKLLIVPFMVQTAAAQTIPPPANLASCDEAVMVRTLGVSMARLDGTMSLTQAAQYEARVVELCRQQKGQNDWTTLQGMDMLAKTYRELGRNAEVLKLREEILTAVRAQAGPDHANTIAGMNNLAASYSDLGRHAEALKLREETLARMRRAPGADDTGILVAMTNLGLSYSELGRHAEALKLREETLALVRAKLGPDHPDAISGMNDLAETEREMGHHAESLKLREELLALVRTKRGPDDPHTFSSMNNLANAYGDLGRYAEALKLHEETLAQRRSKLGADHPDTLSSMHNLANTYGELGRHSDALRLREQTLAVMRAKLGPDHPNTLSGMVNLANSHSVLGRHAEALKLREEALALRRAGLGADHPDTLSSMNNLAISYSELGRHADSLKLREEILASYRANLGVVHLKTLSGMNRLAGSYGAFGRHAEALKLREQTLAPMRAKLGADHPATLGAVNDLAISYGALGRLADIPPLAEAFRSGAEKQRSQPGLSVSDRQSIFVDYANAYRRFGRYLGQLGTARNRPEILAEGFELADLSKARTLLESITGASAARSAGLPAVEIQALQSLGSEMAALDQAIAKQQDAPTPDAETLRGLEARRRGLDGQYVALQHRLKASHAKYAQLLEVKLARAVDARRLVGPDQVVLSYTLETGGALGAWLLDGTGNPRFIFLGFHPKLQEYVARMRAHLRGEIQSPGEVQLRQVVADILLKPLLSDASLGLAGRKRWIIIPDADLALLPFDTLPVTVAGAMTRPLIEAVEISLVQSWSVYALLKEREAEFGKLSHPKQLFAMGNAVYNPATHQTAATIVRTELRRASRGWSGAGYMAQSAASPTVAAERHALRNLSWQNLPGTAREVEAVARVFQSGVDKFTDGQASEARLQGLNRTGALGDYRYLLFSAHGYLASNPALTSVVLSLDKPTPDADGYVTAAEWPAYNVRSELTVLSACDTGVGRTVAGEGVMGLPYALFVAGNRNTMLTLWPVDDEMTAEFMTRFFTRLKNGESQVSALTAVKREFAADRTFGNPRYWAAFVLYGV